MNSENCIDEGLHNYEIIEKIPSSKTYEGRIRCVKCGYETIGIIVPEGAAKEEEWIKLWKEPEAAKLFVKG